MNETLNFLNQWRPSILADFSFGCVAARRSTSGPATAEELDALLVKLPDNVDFEARFTPGGAIVAELPSEPYYDDFDTEEQYEIAYAKYVATRPWVPVPFDLDQLREFLSSALVWYADNLSFDVVSESGVRSRVWTSSDPYEKAQIAEQEREHASSVNRFIEAAVSLFLGSKSCERFDSQHQLVNAPSLSFDETHVIVSESYCLLIWVCGFRVYG